MSSGKDATSTCQAGQSALAARLLKHISASSAGKGRNLVFSPLSIHVALALMSTAAAGETLNQILAVVGTLSREDLAEFVRDTVIDHVLADRSGVGGPSVAFACGTWTDKRWKLNPSYVDTVVDTFKGDSSVVDFRNKPVESRKQINAWVARATKNLITQVLNPNSGNRDTVHVVANAIYFKGDWRTPFKQENTLDLKFHLLDGSSIEVPFLRSSNDQYIACHDGFKVLKLPYQIMEEYSYDLYRSEPSFSMCVFLPGERKGLTDLVEKIASSP
ncbi:hypothetical protein PR202_gb16138 [Eleusine coracana subsp. coracana]|uniref:Serpin domain-containing protein n=1 Tax=Eleusine coracana subsp. coracana TaxID=191504 RepID=A0AAV5F035_ELECO|nr:hypothetical protein QOZ80_9BG0702470 [Eleusine coracana subsp. coracana]GJN28043.1 hypothetical protein PR202_gb16124 [Eleusine coracana subsp. coracana]GJN28057.1 hypothetical protein PR202_gb16138 [Eleusine coracana subsp. coracana]